MTPSGTGFLASLAVLWGLFLTIFWMIAGWRAMRAHERIADSLDRNPGVSSPGDRDASNLPRSL
jgi:hypothetical protein